MSARPLLPNSPLGEVVFEVRFPGDLSLPHAWGELQKIIGTDFPNLFVPHLNPGDAPALTPYRLASSDGLEMVTLSLNSVAFITRRYKTYADFRSRFLAVFKAFTDVFSPRKITRTGLRFVNYLPSNFGDAAPVAGNFHPGLKLKLEGVTGLELQLNQPQLVFTVNVRAHSLRVSLVPDQRTMQGAPSNYQAMASVLLDFDCYSDIERPVTEVPASLDQSHQIVDAAFLGMITPAYEKYLRGEG